MRYAKRLSLAGLLVAPAFASPAAAAQAEEPTASDAAPPPQPPPPQPPPPPPVQTVEAEPLVLTPPKPIGRGVALGYENGLWGSNFMQALRLRIPFAPSFGMIVKTLITHPTDHTHNVSPHFGGGRLDLLGSSPVVGGFARMYGGGGLSVTTKVLGTGGNKDVHVGFAGYFGFELFSSPGVAWFIEIGGGSNVDGSAAGALVTGGIQWYLGS